MDEGWKYCPHCAHSQTDRRAGPLFVIDPVTGLLNEVFFTALLGQEVTRAVRYHRPLAVMVAVVDNVTDIRADLGYASLNSTLREVGDVIAASTREVDTLAFLGLEDVPRYTVLLPETDREGAFQAAEKLRRQVAEHEFNHSGQWRRITMSVGLGLANTDRSAKQDLIGAATDAVMDGVGLGAADRTYLRGEL